MTTAQALEQARALAASISARMWPEDCMSGRYAMRFDLRKIAAALMRAYADGIEWRINEQPVKRRNQAVRSRAEADALERGKTEVRPRQSDAQDSLSPEANEKS